MAIRRTESTTFTEQLGEITKKTDEIKQVVTELARQNKVAAIDRQWDREKERFMITDKDGHRHLPSEGGAVAGGVMVVVFGTIWTVGAAAITSGMPFGGVTAVFPLFGVAFVIFGICISVYSYNKAKEYRSAQRRYYQRRAAAGRDDVFEPGETNESFLAKLENVPTPDEYLEELGER